MTTNQNERAELPEASSETKGICNDERCCSACYSGQGKCLNTTASTFDGRAEIRRLISSSSTIIEFLPERPGYNGSILMIDDQEVARIVTDLNKAADMLAADQEVNVVAWEEQHCEVCGKTTMLVANPHPTAQPAQTGVDPEMGFMIDFANEGELAAYDYAVQSHCLAVLDILNGKDKGGGSNYEPWATVRKRLLELVTAQPAGEPLTEAENDDAAVDRFAVSMKEKLARARDKGRGGWQEASQNVLTSMLLDHVEKGDPTDVANFCMFLWNLGHGIGKDQA